MGLLALLGAEENTLLGVTTTGTVAVSSTQKRTGSYSFRLNGGTTGMAHAVIVPITGDPTEIYFQVAMWHTNYSIYQTGHKFLQWMSGATVLGCLVTENSYILGAYTGDKAVQVATASWGLGTGSWSVLEGRLKIDNSSGVITIRCNGSQVLTFTGDTQPGAVSAITGLIIGNVQVLMSDNYMYLDDIIVCDTNGSYMNSWINGARISRLAPDGAGNYSAWTPSTGSNYACVDEIPPSDTDYVTAASGSGNKDSYGIAAAGADVSVIKAVAARYWGQGGQSIKRLIRISGSDYLGSAFNLPSALGKVDDIMYVSPATSNPFTAAEIGGAEIGMEAQ